MYCLMCSELFLKALDRIPALGQQLWGAAKRLDGQIVSAHAVDDRHVEGSRRPLLQRMALLPTCIPEPQEIGFQGLPRVS